MALTANLAVSSCKKFSGMSTARQIICGYEIFAMIRKGQVKRIPANDMGAQRTLIASLFAIAA